MPDKPLIPPPGLPVRSFNAPDHIEAVHIERVDITSTTYTKLARGTLYSTVVGADQSVVDQYPGLFLLREIISPAGHPWALRHWGVGDIFTTKTIGNPNLTPAKYRRLVRTIETDQPVDASYTFPNGLTGDQTQIQLQQETIEEARLKMISELIAIGGDPLLGAETDPFGPLSIYESVVPEGTPVDDGYLVVKSTVTPFGNGKAVKITVKYPVDLAMRTILNRSIGQDNLIPAKYRRLVQHKEIDSLVDLATYVFPNLLTGNQTEVREIQETIFRARQKITEELIAIGADPLVGQDTFEFGIESITETIVPDGTPADEGFFIAKSTVTPFGNGKSLKINVVYPANISTIPLESDLWDENMRLLYDETEFIVPADTPPDADPGGVFGWLSEVKATDKWHSRKINTSKSTPLYVDAASALISYQFRAFKFPGRLGIFQVGAAVIGDYQAPAAQIVQHKIRTWWEKNSVTPTPAFDEIIAGTVLLGPTGNVTYSDVLHDILFNSLGMIYGPTTPSYAQYTGRTGAIQITGSIHLVNGSAAVVGTGTLFTTELTVGDTLGVSDTAFVILSITDDTHLTLTNAWTSLTTDINQPIFTTFSGGWIGTEKVISASVTPEREKDIWRIQTSSVIMR